MSRTAEKPSRRRISIAQLALIVPWVALVIDAWGRIGDNSFLWHVRAGTAQADLGAVFTTDPFSFTRSGEAWLTQSWLIELLYGWLEGLSGLAFVPWMILLASSLTFVGIGLVGYRESKSVTATAFILILSTLVLISFIVPRPVLFSYLLFVLVVIAWDDRRLRWSLPFLFWIWAAIHGSFVIGLAYVGLTLLMRREWGGLPTAIVSGLATLATAHGLGVLQMLANFGEASGVLPLLSEWRRPTLDTPVFLSFLGGLAFVVIGAARQRIQPRHLWVIVPFLALGLGSVRAIPPAWLGILPVVGIALSGMELGTTGRLSRVPAIIFGLVVLTMPFLLIDDAIVDESRFPVEARPNLADVPTFHDDRVGGYLIWAEWPDRQVYLDDRAELYLGRIREFVEVRNGEKAWEPVFERDGIEQALLRKDEMLVGELQAAGWTTLHSDENYVVLRP